MQKKLTVQEILRLFQSISEMNIAVYDANMHLVASCLYEDDVCSLLHVSPLCLDKCLRSDLENLSLVSKTKKPYVYTCPFGFFEAIFPLFHRDTLTGYIIIGPAIDTENAADRELLKTITETAPELDAEALRRALSSIPHSHGEKLRAFCEVLEIFSGYLESHTIIGSENLTLGQLIKNYVKNNLTQKITLEKLSMALHCNTVTLTETFRREFGLTIMQYVLQERMQRATYLLGSSDASISEIAEHCGIPQTEYFSKCFKAHFGLSPTEWRRKNGLK